MADAPRSPLAGAIATEIGTLSAVEQMLSFIGIHPYIERGERTASAHGASSKNGRHVVVVEDNKLTTDPITTPAVGRYMEMYTLGDSALPVGFGFGRKLAGKVNSDVPDFATYQGFVGMVDGEGRARASGDGRQLQQFTHPLSSGTLRQLAQIGFDGTATFVNHFDATNPNPYIGNITTGPVFVGSAVGAIAYFGAKDTYGRLRLMPQNTSGFTGTVVWEYWNGAAWTALANVTDDTASFNNPVAPFGPPLFVSFTIPDDWATVAVNSVGPHFFIRARITVSTGTASAAFAYGAGVDRILRKNVDLFDGVAALQKIGDAAYWGDPVTFGLLRLAHNDGSAGSLTVSWEYWDGTNWTVLPGLVDGTSAFSASSSPQDVTFTIPGNWTARTIIGSDTLFFIRARLTAVATPIAITSPTATTQLNTTGIVQGAGPVAFDIGDKPGLAGERDPEIIGWGIALPSGVVADPAGLFTYWDPIRKIHSRRFDPAATTNYIPAHGEAHVSEVAQWSDATTAATLVGTGALGAQLNIDTSTADTEITIGVDSGPPVFFDETKPQDERDFSLQGYTATVLRNRVYIARGNRIIWTERRDFHQVAPANGIDAAPNDGDEIVALFTFAEKVIVLKHHHVYAFVGEPSVGTTGIQILELNSNWGCTAKRSIIDVGSQLLFLSQEGVRQMDVNGIVQPIEVSEPVRGIFEHIARTRGDQLHHFQAAWEPTKGLYMLGLAGLQEQMTDGVDPSAALANPIHDGIAVYCRRNGQWDMWPGPPNWGGALGSYWKDSNTRGVMLGTYWGLLLTLEDQANPATVGVDFMGDYDTGNLSAASTLVGSVSAVPSVGDELFDTAATFADANTDTRLRALFVWILTGRAAGEGRIIQFSIPNQLTVIPNWDTNRQPAVGDIYVIGGIYWQADTGDLVWDRPTLERALRSARVLFNGNPLDQPVDIAVDSTSVADTTRGFEFAGGTVRVPITGGTPSPIALPGRRGTTARIRLAGRIGPGADFQDGDSKTRIRQLLLGARTFGRSGDT